MELKMLLESLAPSAYVVLNWVVPGLCCVGSWWFFYLTVAANHATLTLQSHSISVLALRAAVVLPALCTLFMCMYYIVGLFVPLNVLATVVEGYTVRCFWLILVKANGGVLGTVREIACSRAVDNNCGCNTAETCYSLCAACVWCFAYVRPAIWLVSIVFFYDQSRFGPDQYDAAQWVSSIFVVAVLPALVYLVYATRRKLEAVDAKGKILVVKVVVGTLAAQDALVMFLNARDAWNWHDSSLSLAGGESEQESWMRFFTYIAVLEILILSPICMYAFEPMLGLDAIALDVDRKGEPLPSLAGFFRDIFNPFLKIRGDDLCVFLDRGTSSVLPTGRSEKEPLLSATPQPATAPDARPSWYSFFTL